MCASDAALVSTEKVNRVSLPYFFHVFRSENVSYPPFFIVAVKIASMRKVIFVSSNRSDWSKLRPVALRLKHDPAVELSILAVGSHLLQEFGYTIDEIKIDFPRALEVATTVAGDTVATMVDSVGFGIVKIASVFTQVKPDVCIIHGDRFEAFAAAVAANLSNILVGHIEGGELSGTIDGYLRHAVTKLSHIHFACSEDAAHRIRAMGEQPESIFTTGCPSYERLFSIADDSWTKSGASDCFPTLRQQDYILALMHPCVTDEEKSSDDYGKLLEALFAMRKTTVFLYPNIDPGNKRLIQTLHKHQKIHKDWPDWLNVRTHIPPTIFAVLMRNAAVMVGNSSAGIRETCVFGTPTLNLGSRQTGRLKPKNVTTFEDVSAERVVKWVTEHWAAYYLPSTEFGRAESPLLIADVIRHLDVVLFQHKTFSEFQHLVPLIRTPLKSGIAHAPPLRKPRVLAIITARGGSKGIPRKNIIDINGKPLIHYTIEAALAAKSLDRCILSSDCQEIGQIASEAGCEVPFMRPAELANDDSAHLACIRHAIQTLADSENYHADYVMILQPTSPFRTSEDIDNAIEIVRETSCDAVISVSKVKVPFTKLHYLDEQSGVLEPYVYSLPTADYVRRQDAPSTFMENGAIFLQRVSSVLHPCGIRAGSLFSEDVRPYIMPASRSLDLDEWHDLRVARALMNYKGC